jgi:hypothetical protein
MRNAMSSLVAAFALFATVVFADPAAPVTAPGITINGLGIFCRPGTTTTEPAPETTLGYIHQFPGTPDIAFGQQEVPARLGIHFGVIVTADRDILGVRAETWKPGATRPEIWYADLITGAPRARGFVFEFPEELVPGIWRMDAYDGATLLYRIEWEVLPGSELPGVTSDCDFVA